MSSIVVFEVFSDHRREIFFAKAMLDQAASGAKVDVELAVRNIHSFDKILTATAGVKGAGGDEASYHAVEGLVTNLTILSFQKNFLSDNYDRTLQESLSRYPAVAAKYELSPLHDKPVVKPYYRHLYTQIIRPANTALPDDYELRDTWSAMDEPL